MNNTESPNHLTEYIFCHSMSDFAQPCHTSKVAPLPTVETPKRARVPVSVPRVTRRAKRVAESAFTATVPTHIVNVHAARAIASIAIILVVSRAIRDDIFIVHVPKIEDARSIVGFA